MKRQMSAMRRVGNPPRRCGRSCHGGTADTQSSALVVSHKGDECAHEGPSQSTIDVIPAQCGCFCKQAQPDTQQRTSPRQSSISPFPLLLLGWPVLCRRRSIRDVQVQNVRPSTEADVVNRERPLLALLSMTGNQSTFKQQSKTCQTQRFSLWSTAPSQMGGELGGIRPRTKSCSAVEVIVARPPG